MGHLTRHRRTKNILNLRRIIVPLSLAWARERERERVADGVSLSLSPRNGTASDYTHARTSFSHKGRSFIPLQNGRKRFDPLLASWNSFLSRVLRTESINVCFYGHRPFPFFGVSLVKEREGERGEGMEHGGAERAHFSASRASETEGIFPSSILLSWRAFLKRSFRPKS